MTAALRGNYFCPVLDSGLQLQSQSNVQVFVEYQTVKNTVHTLQLPQHWVINSLRAV